MALSESRRGVALGMAAGFATTVLVLGFAAMLSLPLADTLAGRLQLLVLAALAPALTLAVSIARLAAHRFRTPQDLDGSGLAQGSDTARLLQALLQNTLEQLALALPVYAAWALLAPVHLLAVVVAAALLFVLGRVLFFWGYARGAPGRALGFALTFYPTLALLVGACVLAARFIAADIRSS